MADRPLRAGVAVVIGRRGPAASLALACLVSACDIDSATRPLPPIDPLPDDLAAIQFTASGRPTAPHTMLELRRPDGFTGFVAVDGDGRPVWYHRTTGTPFSFAVRHGGDLVLLDSGRGLLVVTPGGDVVHELAQEDRPGRYMHHDVAVTAANTVLFLAEERRGVGEEVVTGEAVWEWVPETGSVARRWSAFDHLAWTVDRGDRSRPEDWLHANSIAPGSRGNLLMSLHFLNQVISIEPGFGGVEWRLGGVNATIAVEDPFSGQHTAAEVGPARILLFDNGFEREAERYSRAVEYDVSDGVGRVVWEWRPEQDNWARVISGARRLPNGNTLVGFGTARDSVLGSTGPIEVYEVTRAGQVVWHLVVSGEVSSMYRATPLFVF